MSWVFTERCNELERMDVETMDPTLTAEVMKALEITNTWLGGVHATLSCLKTYSRAWPAGSKIRLIDWGTGGADIPRAIVRWCRRRGFQVEVLAIDNNATTIDYARQVSAGYPEITLRLADLKEEAIPDHSFDYALSSLTLHHLTNAQIVSLLKTSDRVTRRGLIMNDLKRSARAWAWIWSLSRLLRAPDLFQDDGPLSVKRAFTKHELEALAAEAGLSYLKVKTFFGYRYTLAGEK